MRLKLIIICLKDTNEGDELILRRSSMKLPFSLFGNNLDFNFYNLLRNLICMYNMIIRFLQIYNMIQVLKRVFYEIC